MKVDAISSVILQMIIRPLKANEVDKLLVLWKEFMNDPSAIDGPLIIADDENTGKMREFVGKLVAEEPRQVLVAEEGGELVGYLIFQKQAKMALRTIRQWGYISDLYVDPSFRSRGIGKALLKRCLAELESLGVSHVRLNVWSENHRAMRLYKESGFREYLVLMEAALSKKVQ